MKFYIQYTISTFFGANKAEVAPQMWHFPTFSTASLKEKNFNTSGLSCQNPLKYVLFGLLHIALRPSLHPSLHPVLPVPFFSISPLLTFDFHCGWLAEGDSFREAAVPQWSTTFPLSLCPFIPPPLRPPLPSLPLDWIQIEGSAGYGHCWERAWGDWGLSNHRRNGVGARRLIASQSGTGKDVCLSLTKPMVKQNPKLPTICQSPLIEETEMWAVLSKVRVIAAEQFRHVVLMCFIWFIGI